MKLTQIFLILLIAILASITACKKSDPTDPGGKATLTVSLTDGPGDYQQVNIEILDVEVNQNGWISLDSINPGIYDLIQLSGGLDTLLGKALLPEGKLNQIRLILGSNNTVMIDSILHSLNTPSGQQSGLKVQINEDLQAGVSYQILLDFDAGRSVVKAGNSGKYNLKPVIRAIIDAESGSIRGKINPANIQTSVLAISGTDSISTYSDTSGCFLLRGVSPGNWSVELSPPTASGYQDTTLTNVGVNLGMVTEMGTISLP